MTTAIFTQCDWKIQEVNSDGCKWEFDISQMNIEGTITVTEKAANIALMETAPKMYNKLKALSDLMPFLDQETHPQIELDAVKHDIDTLLAEARGEAKE
ncbi:hypothetical protein OTK49_02815 [Vibrio coralliirubri]|uniref:hypothetical protein n=1 Tax=Vibrio coralliirubri TaxID=1516159 RepID=UPI00228516CF|nr:hypothetical protein [Vibrio coralliirubri]MCY9861450.1 hypothetical protein [Vibrio coralliirubri]